MDFSWDFLGRESSAPLRNYIALHHEIVSFETIGVGRAAVDCLPERADPWHSSHSGGGPYRKFNAHHLKSRFWIDGASVPPSKEVRWRRF